MLDKIDELEDWSPVAKHNLWADIIEQAVAKLGGVTGYMGKLYNEGTDTAEIQWGYGRNLQRVYVRHRGNTVGIR